MSIFRYFLLFHFVFFFPSVQAGKILKVKDQQALVDLDGVETKKGAYFAVVDLYGKKKGIIQMTKVAHTKAIGVLTYGSISREWTLEPMSVKQAMAVKAKAFKLGRLKKEKLKRRRLAEAAKKQLEDKKRAVMRKLASVDGGLDIVNELSEENISEQSDEILSYNSPSPLSSSYNEYQKTEDYANENKNTQLMTQEETPSYNWGFVGGELSPKYNFLYAMPEKKSKHLRKGFGYEGSLIFNLAINSFIKVAGNVGYRKFLVSADEKQCGERGGCRTEIDYVSTGADLKLNLIGISSHKLWLSGGGFWLFPLFYNDKNGLTETSYSPVHGGASGSLGLDLNFGPLVVPISIKGNLYIPVTKTTVTGTVGLNLGLAYRF